MPPVTTALAVEPRRADAVNLARCLRTIGVRTYRARTVAGALRLLRSRLFDIGVVASELGVDGGWLLARLASLPSPRIVLAVASSAEGDMERRARLAGAGACVVRPVDPKSLMIALACAGGRAEGHGLYVADMPKEFRSRDSPHRGEGP